MLSLFDNKYYKHGVAKKLVIFIHGYNGSPESVDYAVQMLYGQLHDAVIVVPKAPYICEKNKDNLQWLSFYAVDPEARFRQKQTTTDEIFCIFNQLGNSFADMAGKMNSFIDEQQKLWQIDDSHTYLAGFSQGAMLSIYTGLTRKGILGGCIALAGIVPGQDKLQQEIVSRPEFLILHGCDDATVQYKTLPVTLNWFQQQNIPFSVFEFDNLAHQMNAAEMQKVADFINLKE